MNPQKTRYALVGSGDRASLFLDALANTYAHQSELVGLCDLSQTRMDWHKKQLGNQQLPTYLADSFEDMIFETKPHTVIVTTMDSAHHQYIIRAMELGCDVISEKPMTTDAAKAQAIFDTIERTGRNLRITFNYRYTPIATKIRELIQSGSIGTPQHINFQWVLDTSHGADYFRRWHRQKENSGGLLVHKATHHFDLVNWWIDSRPEQVFAMGDLRFYGKENAQARGESYDYDRYTGSPQAKSDPFAIDLEENEHFKGLYRDAEQESGYVRDQNVFGEGITTEDTLSVTARYQSGAMLTYSLVAYSPWEGCHIAITGDRGRIEVGIPGRLGKSFVGCHNDQSGAGESPTLIVHPMFGERQQVQLPQHIEGSHGGADPLILEQLFSKNPTRDPHNREADHKAGAASILMGIAANQSIATQQMVNIGDLMNLDKIPTPKVEFV